MARKCLILAAIALFLFACETVPVTGRQQLSLIPASQVNSMSFDAYDDFLKEHQVVNGTSDARMVERTGEKIQKAVEAYLSNNNMSDRLQGYKWEFNLVKDDAVNAFCMPGGKVVVYTGIIPVAQSEAGLAVVMGHEIAHAIANHGNERMSQSLLVQMGGEALSVALAEKPAETRQLFMSAFGVGSQVGVLLPYSRLQESEADHLGLIFMSMAGYDPHAAADFWQRMAQQKSGGSTPEFLSTHPADQTRIENIRQLIPEAMKYYRQ